MIISTGASAPVFIVRPTGHNYLEMKVIYLVGPAELTKLGWAGGK